MTAACKQLRVRDCFDCIFYLYSKTEPIIETSKGIKFAPFNGAYPDHAKHMAAGGLIPAYNLWYAVYDFNDEAKVKGNWSFLPESDEAPLWRPLAGDETSENCCPRVSVGSIPLPSQGADPEEYLKALSVSGGDATGVTKPFASSGGMASFSFSTSLSDAAKATGDLFLAQETQEKAKPALAPVAEASAAAAASATPPSLPVKVLTKSKIGWNAGAAGLEGGAPSSSSPAPAPAGKVGWNPAALSGEAAAAPAPPAADVPTAPAPASVSVPVPPVPAATDEAAAAASGVAPLPPPAAGDKPTSSPQKVGWNAANVAGGV